MEQNVFWFFCILSCCYFGIFTFCSFCILFHLYFGAFVNRYICILANKFFKKQIFDPKIINVPIRIFGQKKFVKRFWGLTKIFYVKQIQVQINFSPEDIESKNLGLKNCLIQKSCGSKNYFRSKFVTGYQKTWWASKV